MAIYNEECPQQGKRSIIMSFYESETNLTP